MRSLSNETKTALSTPVREFKARVEVHRNSTLIGTYTQADAIQKAVIERIAEDGRFFGIGVCQKLKLTLVDKKVLGEASIDGINDITRATGQLQLRLV